MSASAIEWTDETWNPTTGCDKISPGCSNCYIERTIPFRVEGRKFDEHGKMGVRLHPDRLDKPYHWRKPRRVFVNSLSDLFHAEIPEEFIAQVFDVMIANPQHTYQILTKRPQRMRKVIDRWFMTLRIDWRNGKGQWTIPPWIWLGTTIESDRYTFRAEHLRNTEAGVRFLSLEPLLGPLPSLDLTAIDWVIVGGESGPGARPMNPQWARDLRDRCVEAEVPFFFKQWGEWGPQPSEVVSLAKVINGDLFFEEDHLRRFEFARVGKKKAGRELDGRTWDEIPAVIR